MLTQPPLMFPHPGAEEVERVICASLAADKENIYATMAGIRDSALRHNPKAGLHAALLYQSGWFLHWVEGPAQAVRELFERIGRDGRHRTQYVVHHSRGRRLLETHWSMMLSPDIDSSANFASRVLALHQQLLGSEQMAPNAVIRRLASPLRLPQAMQPSDPEAFYRIGVCCAAQSGSFDLVQWLAEQHGAVRTRRRVAGEADNDSGSDYVDFMHGDYPCRVVALSRLDLVHGLRRAFLPDWQFLVLLFSGIPKADAALMQLVEQAFHDLPWSPELLAITPNNQTYEQMQSLAHASALALINGGHGIGDNAALWQAAAWRLEQIGAPPKSGWSLREGLNL